MNKNIVTVRRGAPADYPHVHGLILEFAAFQKTPEKVTITLEEMVASEDVFTCLIAEHGNGEIIGFASFFIAFYSWSGKALYLDDLFIRESYRKLKAGSLLLEEVIRYARHKDCKNVRWLVSDWNTNAIDFYKKIGAVVNKGELICELRL
jgi:diamine N-acetyltransferase